MDPPEKVKPIPVSENKLAKYQTSAHFVEQKLKYGKKAIGIGIKLTGQEDRLIHCLMFLRKKKNESNKENQEIVTKMVEYGCKNPQKCITETITYTEKEILNEFYCKKKPSGSDIKHLRNVLQQLGQKQFNIKYRKVISKKGEESFIDETKPLIKIHSKVPPQNTKGTTTYTIQLHPIFTDQIDTKYVLFPECIYQRTLAASKRIITDSTIRLRDYLLSEISAGRYKCELNEDTLIFRLHLEKHLLIRRKTRAIGHILKSIEVCVKIGIISKYEVVIGCEDQKKYVFYLRNLTGLLSQSYGVVVTK